VAISSWSLEDSSERGIEAVVWSRYEVIGGRERVGGPGVPIGRDAFVFDFGVITLFQGMLVSRWSRKSFKPTSCHSQPLKPTFFVWSFYKVDCRLRIRWNSMKTYRVRSRDSQLPIHTLRAVLAVTKPPI
jgi:hypothetical protein